MTQFEAGSPEPGWMCANCGQALVPAKVEITYLGNSFPVELLTCPNCGLVLIPEDLATGKMAEVEKTLEDK